MNRFTIALLATFATISAVAAHGGHVAAQSGHSHWIAVAAAVLAVGVAVGGLVHRYTKRRAR